MNYYIGIDGGGTKTMIRAVNEKMETLDTIKIAGSNISSIGYSKTDEILREGIRKILNRNNLTVKNCKGLCIGASGVDREKERIEIETIFRNMGFDLIRVMNDTAIVLKTVTDRKEGIVVIAGTGSIVLGIKNKDKIRAGGWGYKLGDEGSAYWIGMQGIKAVLKAYDHVEPCTQLTNVVLDYFNIKKTESFIELFYKQSISKNKISEISVLVDQVARKGDAVALEILEEGGFELSKQVIAVYQRLFKDFDGKIPVILNGSVVLKSNIFRKSLVNHLEKNANNLEIKMINKDSSIGACKFAFKIT